MSFVVSPILDAPAWRITIIVTVTCMTAVIAWSIIAAVISPLRSVPGPFLARFTKLWYAWQVYKGQFHLQNINLHKQYGPVVRLAPNMYSIDTPDAIKTIYRTGSKFYKTEMYTAFQQEKPPPRNDIFTERDPVVHRENRRKVANIYSSTAVAKMESSVPECMVALRREFDHIAAAGKTIDLQFWLQCYALDFISLVTLGERFGCLDGGKDVDNLMHKLDRWLSYAAVVGPFGQYHWTIGRLLGKYTPVARIDFLNIIMPVFSKASESGGNVEKIGNWTALDEMLSTIETDPSKLSPIDAITQAITNIGAGSDTTSLSSSAILYYLIQHPKCISKLRDEIEKARQQGQYSDPPTYQECQKLEFFQACIYEGLRMHSAVGLPLERYVPPEGAEIAGVQFPGGTIVGVNTWAIHYSEKCFGPDAHLFRPERWIEGTPEEIRELERYWVPFGPIGSRFCIGKGISMMEMSTLLPELVRRYDFELDNDGQPMEATNIWFVKPTNLFSRVKVRA